MVADPKPGFLQTRDSRKPETRVWKKGAGFAFPIVGHWVGAYKRLTNYVCEYKTSNRLFCKCDCVSTVTSYIIFKCETKQTLKVCGQR